MDRVTDRLEKSEQGRMVLDGLLREVVSKRRELYERLEQSNQPADGGDEQKQDRKSPQATPQVTIDTAPPQPAPASTTEVVIKLRLCSAFKCSFNLIFLIVWFFNIVSFFLKNTKCLCLLYRSCLDVL